MAFSAGCYRVQVCNRYRFIINESGNVMSSSLSRCRLQGVEASLLLLMSKEDYEVLLSNLACSISYSYPLLVVDLSVVGCWV